jgi:hypothetical protein
MQRFKATLIILAIVMIVLFCTLYSVMVQVPSPIINETVKVYTNAECTHEMTSPYTWSQHVYNGAVISIWIKNVGNVDVQVTLSISNATNCEVTLNPSQFTLLPGQTQKVDMIFSNVDTTKETASWTLNVNSEV